VCPACDEGESCVEATDCASGFCDVNTCAACDGDEDCAAIADSYCAAGACTPKKAAGEPCDGQNECLSGFCPGQDGVCCSSPCSGACVACAGAKTNLGQDGVCDDVKQNTDPDDECLLSCNGNGACQL
jgi:hypothetical protein